MNDTTNELITMRVTPAERDAMLAGLRLAQHWIDRKGSTKAFTNLPREIDEIFTLDGSHEGLAPDEIDALCEQINRSPDKHDPVALLKEAVDEWPEFDGDESVNGGDLVEFFGDWRERAKKAVKEHG